MRAASLLVAPLAVLAAVACASRPADDAGAASGFVLVSPFSGASDAAWRDRIGAEIVDVARLLRVETPSPPVSVFLESKLVGADAPLIETLDPNVGGMRAWSVGGREIHVVVADAQDGLFSATTDGSIRHELVHVLLARMGIDAPPWFGEGLAHEVEDAVRTRRGLVLHPAPVQVVLARALAPEVDLAEVWAWDGDRTAVAEREAIYRAVSRSFVRFLVEREGSDEWPLRVRELASLRTASDPALVDEWRRWSGGFDFAGAVERGLRDPDTDVRRAAAASLPSLAELATRLGAAVPAIAAEVGPRTDAVALGALADPVACEPAACYLVFFRAAVLPETSVGALSGAGRDPRTRLVGLALRARRGAPAGTDDVLAAWDGLDASERIRFSWLRVFLPVPDPLGR